MFVRRVLLCGVLVSVLAASPVPTTAPVSPLLADAHRVLANVKETQYAHKTAIDEEAGSYQCDCSGLVGYLLKRTLPEHYKLISCPPGKRPLAVHFHDAFAAADPLGGAQRASGNHPTWQRVAALKDAQPGDVIAWRRVEQIPGENTGHVVLLDAAPVPDGANVFKITVIDSTSLPHADDTRKPGQTGVGRGTLWIKVDDQGAPAGYRNKSKGLKFTEVPIAIGRPWGAHAMEN